ncbi:MAG: dGTP triphosphohydrolase [Candidatus Limnocylindria bacterium]
MKWTELLNAERHRRSTIREDHREEFERDFDRCVFSTPVKRLADKTQVFPLETHDAVRTRLTHSLEVSSVARGLARLTGKWLKERDEINETQSRSIEAIAATCGLLHDLGNPPFGHFGEAAIQDWFATDPGRTAIEVLRGEAERATSPNTEQLIADFTRFEGNAQTLRLVGTLQVLADYSGLNLTFGTLSALMKYVSPSDRLDNTNKARKKPGFFASEERLVEEARRKTGTGDVRNPIAYIVEAADDIVYLTTDIEDAVKKWVVSWAYLEQTLEQAQSASAARALDRLKTILKADRATVPAELEDDVRATAFRTAAIGEMVVATGEAFKNKYEEIMSGTYRGALLDDSTAGDLGELLRGVAKRRVYTTTSTLTLELLGHRIINELMDLLWSGIQALPIEEEPSIRAFSGKAAAIISPNYRRVFRHEVSTKEHLPAQYHRLRLLTDYICGMTDSFAKRRHAELLVGG